MASKKQPQSRKLISFDWAMKSVLRQKSSFAILEGLISTILKENIKIDAILETESNPRWEDGRYVRTDIQARNTEGDIYIIEIQYAYEINYFHRILYSASVAIQEYLKAKKGFDDIKRIISLTIAYSHLGVGKDYVYKGNNQFIGIHDNSELELSEVQQEKYKIKKLQQVFPEYWIIRLKQYNNELNDTLDEWIYFFKNSCVEKDFTAKGLKKAAEKLDEISFFKGNEHEYNEYIKFVLDRNSQIAQMEDERLEKITLQKTIEEKDKTIEEKDKTIEETQKANVEAKNIIEEKDKTIEEKDKANVEAKKTIEEKDKAIEEKDKAIRNSILFLAKHISDIKNIANTLGVSTNLVKKVLKNK